MSADLKLKNSISMKIFMHLMQWIQYFIQELQSETTGRVIGLNVGSVVLSPFAWQESGSVCGPVGLFCSEDSTEFREEGKSCCCSRRFTYSLFYPPKSSITSETGKQIFGTHKPFLYLKAEVVFTKSGFTLTTLSNIET